LNKKGFTLVEVLIAAAIFLSAVALAGYTYRMMKIAVVQGKERSLSLYAARAEMETLSRLPFDELISFNGNTFASGKGRIEIAALAPDIMSIGLELKWHPARPAVSLVTLKGKE
jgi:prepilin-type N-terminal cleavage/methylation domain-containing protein